MTTTITRRTELAHRTSDGIDVHLFWNEPTSRVTVGVSDARTDDCFELEVDGRHALDAFNHPYAYAARTDTAGLAALLDSFAASSDSGGESKSNNHQPWRTDHASTDR